MAVELATDTRKAEPVPAAVAPFAEWEYKDAAEAIVVPDNYAERRAYAEDDHWQDGAGFIGPMPVSADARGLAKKAKIQKQFASNDACGEGLSAIEDAFSTEAQIGAVPREAVPEGQEIPKEIQTLADEAIGVLTLLWDRVRIHEELKPAIRTSAWAERADLNWWIPPGRALRGSDGIQILPRAENFEAAVTWLALHRPMPDTASIVIDKATQERAAVYLDEVIDGDNKLKRAVVAYASGEKTVFRFVYENEAKPADDMELETGGLLPMAEMRGDNLLTKSVIATQKQLDYVESVMTRMVETGGFPERYIGNAEPAGIWVALAPGEAPVGPTEVIDGKTWQRIPEPRMLGADVTTELVGITTLQEDGKRLRATPAVDRFEPVDPQFAINAGKHSRAKILKMMRQGHRVGDSTAEASGFAYQQERAGFEKDLLNRKGAAEGMLRDLLTSALGLIEALANKPGYFTKRLRITVDIHVDAGPRSPEERNQDREDVKANLLSPETAISRNGVEDVQAEVGRIGSSSRLALLKEAAEVFNTIAMASSAPAAVRALIAAGVDPEIANALLPEDTDGGGVEQ